MPDEKLTVDRVLSEFAEAHEAKRSLIEQQRDDHLFALGKQWEDEDVLTLKRKGVKAITDNRLRTNIYLITGLERQNRSDFRAFPEGDEDGIKAEIATALFKNVMKRSEGDFKFSEMFEDGVTGGESYIELYLDSTFNLINPKPQWRKINFDQIYPEPGWKEYNFTDASYVYKFTTDVKKGDLINLFPEKKKKLENLADGKIDAAKIIETAGVHTQERDYPDQTQSGDDSDKKNSFDLLERYYKKWIERVFVLDTEQGDLIESQPTDDDDKRTPEKIARDFISNIIKRDSNQKGRFKIFKRVVPEIWYFAVTGGLMEPLTDEKAWFYPRWKSWPFVSYLAHWSSISLPKKDSHYGVQGVVRNSKDSQIEHNKRKTQLLRIIDSTANSGWLTEEGAWVDRKKVENFGSVPGINLEYKAGRKTPERIFPMPISQSHVFTTEESAESIKAQTGINSDLLAVQDNRDASGRAIALRQRQGVVMVQKLFDNLSRTKKIAGLLVLSQFSEIYDKKSIIRVLGEAFIQKNFSHPVQDPSTGQVSQVFDESSFVKLESVINQILNDINIGKYDVSIGEVVMNETMKLAQFGELKDFAATFPGVVTPNVIIEESSLPQNIKSRILSAIQQAQQSQQAQQVQQIQPNQQQSNGQQRQEDRATESLSPGRR